MTSRSRPIGGRVAGSDLPRGTVLVVDPDDEWRESARLALQSAGYEVIEAGTAVEALRRMAGRRVQVVATNYPMRLPNGSPLARVLLANAVPVLLVAVTSIRGAASYRAAAADGCHAVVLKPVSPDALVEVVDLLTVLPK